MNTRNPRFYLHLLVLLFGGLAVVELHSQTLNYPSVTDYGAVGDGITNDLPAFEAAITDALVASSSVYPRRGIVVVPPGTYFLNGTLLLTNSVHLIGHGSGREGGNWATVLKFPPNITGIKIMKGNSNPTEQGGDSTILEGLLVQGGGGSDSNAHGIHMRGRTKIRDCTIKGFKGHGIAILADVNSGGNANCWSIDTVTTTENGGNGLFTDGGDCNAGMAISLTASNNEGWGIFDSSFLGNTYIGCHAVANGLGAYKTDNANARNVFAGCSSNMGQPASAIRAPSIVLGGRHSATVTGTGYRLIDGVNRSVATAGADPNLVVEGLSGALLTFFSDNNSLAWRLKYETGKWFLSWANISGGTHMHLYNRAATPANGYSRDLSGKSGGVGFPQGFYGGAMKFRGEKSAAPTTGTWLQGDICYNLSPVAGGHIGWVCVAGGTPGTWKKFGPLQP